MAGYLDLFNASLESPKAFWADAAEAVTWIRKPKQILDDSNPPFYRWFPDGELNTSYNCLDRHVAGGRADQPALIYDSPVTGSQRTYTYRELLEETQRFAGTLHELGVVKGDCVVIYMPMIPEAVIAMLACARLGAVHSVVFGGFAARRTRGAYRRRAPTLVVSASCGVEPTRTVDYKPMLDAALEMAEHAPRRASSCSANRSRCQLVEGRDLDWHELMADAQPVEVPVAATDPLYVLYTSGTTGKPKGIVRDNGGHAVALMWSMRHIYGTAARRCLLGRIRYRLGGRTLLHRVRPAAGRCDNRALRRQTRRHARRGRVLARRLRAPGEGDVHRTDGDPGDQEGRPRGQPPRKVRPVGAAVPVPGRRTPRPRYLPLGSGTPRHPGGRPLVADRDRLVHRGQPDGRRGSRHQARLGDDTDARLRPAHPAARRLRVRPREEGAICVRLPLPPGTLPTLWGDDDRYIASYLSAFPGYYLTGDGGYLDEDGYLFVMGRTDDVINVAGHRLSTGSIEAVLATHPAVAECAVIGVADEIKGQVPRGLVVLKAGASADRLAEELVDAVRETIGAVACFKTVDVVPALPKTRSGKILRKTMRGIADGRDEPVPSTIEDPAVLDALKPILTR